MSYEPKDNSGSLFVNDRKDTEKHPDRTGSAIIDGRQYWVSGWLRETNGKKWLSLAFKLKDQQPAADDQRRPVPAGTRPPMGNGPRQSTRSADLDDDSVPF